ncbi:MAG TPA: DUF2130 domain-containing protein [Candidatus Saccharimonadales bacterium]|nr:DUF2130 domain-containing protein [Candidatus Saccharimonadales bacterium]
MMTIKCTHCGKDIELSEALTKDIESSVLEAEHNKHIAELEKVKTEASENAQKEIDEAKQKATAQAQEKLGLKIRELQDESAEDKKDNRELREQLKLMMLQLRESNKAKENAEIEMQKKLVQEEVKIREEAEKSADERQRLKLAEKDKQLEAARKANDDLQRKLNQGSQQMQGEILELDLEDALGAEFRDDIVAPVDKGVKGADITHTVRSARGNECGIILWEIKRTKAWTEGWIQKLKDDMRATKANIPVIISEVLPREIKGEIVFHNGVWVAKPSSALILASLLRKSLLDVYREKAISQNRETSAESIYNFVTSHEFVQQVEAMVEVYTEMIIDITKEKASFDRIWAKRENQAKKLLGSTANIIGSMQGQLGMGAMPRIKGLDLLESGDE